MMNHPQENHSWVLDEMAFAGSEHLDPEYVKGYEAKSGYDPTEDVEILRNHGLNKTSEVLDIGCGTGVFTMAAAPLAKRVVAVDVSPAMLEAARQKTASLNNVEIVKGGFLSYRPDTDIDFIFSKNALHHLPDFWKGLALENMAGYLKPGGILRIRDLIYDFSPKDAPAKLQEWFTGAADDPQKGYTIQDLSEHVRTEFSTYSWIFDEMLEEAGLKIIDRQYARSVYGTYTCVKT
jgi:SAM-dependent methyltransferase